ncbi:thiamine transporter [Clostridium cavendishii DSM 21758]|uniref:Thiamine transporter n=1 Tax=Clostridium cavendishii DSM 21758 TaxID=1121302 RepID=A0A1M6PCU6_9CLOT|nr:energy-coupled thiamine transporter ThiT [Clostridium cavendishii]SHK05769.1 thiamine transporter [Clostridium cavendishii DSM 21758]
MNYLQKIFYEFSTNLYKFFSKLPENSHKIFSNPLSLITILGLLVLLVVIIKTKHIKMDARLISRIGMALALATILHMFKLYHFPQGGSVTLGSMIPIILIAFIYGPLIGCLTGLLFGIINLFMNPYILTPIQVLFDYPLPFLALGIAGFFKNKKMLGTFLAMFGRFICHFISGVAFFGNYAPKGTSPWLYSLTINASLIGTETFICLVIMYFLPIQRLIKLNSKTKMESFKTA